MAQNSDPTQKGDNAKFGEGKYAGGDVTVEEFMAHSYDYLICGGGTAGLVVAARLSENPDITVGVIEAGKNRIGDPLVEIPGLCFAMLSNPDYDWTMKTVPQVWLCRRPPFPLLLVFVPLLQVPATSGLLTIHRSTEQSA